MSKAGLIKAGETISFCTFFLLASGLDSPAKGTFICAAGMAVCLLTGWICFHLDEGEEA